MTFPRYASSILLVVVFAIYGAWIAPRIHAFAGGADSSGYMNDARLLERMQFKVKRREIEGLSSDHLPSYAYVPLGFVPTGAHEMAPTYPMGFPLLILLMSRIVGWDQAAGITIFLHAMLSLFAVYWLSIVVGLSRPLSLLGAIFLGLSSVFVWMSLQAMSDVPTLAWCLLTILFALLSGRAPYWSLFAGTAFSICVLIRPANVLMVFPLAIIFGLDWKRWILFGLGGVPGAIFQGVVNWQLYRSVLATGYGDVRYLFKAGYFWQSARAYAQWLPVALTPALVFVACVPFIRRVRGNRMVVMLAAWAGAFLGFYAFYFHTHENWTYMRFVLPAFGAIIVLMIMVIRECVSGFSTWLRWILGLALLTFVVGWNAVWLTRLGVSSRGEVTYPAAAAWAKENLPGNAVILSMQMTGALFYYTDFTLVRYDQFDRESFSKVERACATAGRPIYAILFPFETDPILAQRTPGRWSRIGSVENATIWRRDGA